MYPSFWRAAFSILALVACAGPLTGQADVTPLPPAAPAQAPVYEVGGPLAGLVLPPTPIPPGLPDWVKPGFVLEGNAPEVLLYPGSVEHWRAYWFKYCPVRSNFDQQSQLKNWVAPGIPGATPGQQTTYASPIRKALKYSVDPKPTGAFLPPVPVVRFGAGQPPIKLDLGTLPAGVYTVRIIGAVPPEQLKPFRLPLVLGMTVNDRLDGSNSVYKVRSAYTQEFYSVQEFYFHAPQLREYKAEISVDPASKVELLIHNISLDDVLAGTLQRPIKTRATLRDAYPPMPKEPSKYSKQERMARDEAIWNLFPGNNIQGGGLFYGPTLSASPGMFYSPGVKPGTPEADGAKIEEKYGTWETPGDGRGGFLHSDPKMRDAFLYNRKLNLKYTVDDLLNRRPLPDPYPYKDDGLGILTPDATDPGTGHVWSPVANGVMTLIQQYHNNMIRSGAQQGWAQPNPDVLHDASIALIRYAYMHPTLDNANYLPMIVTGTTMFGRDGRFAQREAETRFHGHFGAYTAAVEHYDSLFNYINGNQAVADSVNRFVPWVKTPKDVIQLLDVYLVQVTARRILRYQCFYYPTAIATVATVLGDMEVTRPWMQWVNSRTFFYPMATAGVQDSMISGTDQNGANIGNGGSTSYCHGEGAGPMVEAIDRYVRATGDTGQSLSDPSRYFKPLAHARWTFGIFVAGGTDYLRIGDVTGPDKTMASGFWLLEPAARAAWRWSKDPRFAFILKTYFTQAGMTDQEWQEVQQAGGTLSRAPWLSHTSRTIPNWAGILESGIKHDDPRVRAAAYVRTGYGQGHGHYDALDLQVVANGVPATIDGGQRVGYTFPGDAHARVHNLVEVDGKNRVLYSWTKTIADHDGVQYLAADSAPVVKTERFKRQVALIDVNTLATPVTLEPALQRPGVKLPPLPVSAPDDWSKPAEPGAAARLPQAPSYYVFDVQRSKAGKMHTFCFHGTVNDGFEWNALSPKPVVYSDAPVKEEEAIASYKNPATYLAQGKFRLMREEQASGTSPEVLEAIWRLDRSPGIGSEQRYMGPNYDEKSGRKFTKLRLFNTQGSQVLRAESVSKQPNLDYHFTNLMVQKFGPDKPLQAGAEMETVFPAIIEPYVGTAFIQKVDQLAPVTQAPEDGHAGPVALRLTLPEGREDICFADGSPGVKRRFESPKLDVSGEFAFVSRDKQGLRQAQLVGGTVLAGEDFSIQASTGTREAQIARINFSTREVLINQAWPAGGPIACVQIGTQENKQSVAISETAQDGTGTRLTVDQALDMYRSPILSIDPAGKTIKCAMDTWLSYFDSHPEVWAISNDEGTRFWRAKYEGNATWKVLDDAPATMPDFGATKALRAWYFAPGDTVTQTTSACLKRVKTDTYELISNVDVTLGLGGRAMETSRDGQAWQDAPGGLAKLGCDGKLGSKWLIRVKAK